MMRSASVSRTAVVEESIEKVNEEVAVGEDLGFQRGWWRFERATWVFFCLLLVADLAGAFGRGPLANATLKSGDGTLDVSYERIERSDTPSMLKIKLGSPALHAGIATLYVSQSVVDALGAERIIPQPLSTTIGHGGLTYQFAATAPPASVEIALRPGSPGLFGFALGVPGSDTLRARVAVVP